VSIVIFLWLQQNSHHEHIIHQAGFLISAIFCQIFTNFSNFSGIRKKIPNFIITPVYLLYLYLSVKRSHHVRREGLENPTLIQKREEYTLLDFMKV
jgi:hypothetical protein